MADAAPPLVQADRIQRAYRAGQARTVALKPASFHIPRNARIALVGPSGSGKSTLLGLIAGLDAPDRGSLAWPGLPVRAGRPADVAVAFQASSLIPVLTVAENVALPLLLKGHAPAQATAQARAALARFGLEGLADKLPDSISGGQAQRAALARAVAAGPRLLLADEPTGQLDHVTGLAAIDTILAWCEAQDCALVVATHDPLVAGRLGSRWTIDHGQLGIPGEHAALGNAA